MIPKPFRVERHCRGKPELRGTFPSLDDACVYVQRMWPERVPLDAIALMCWCVSDGGLVCIMEGKKA